MIFTIGHSTRTADEFLELLKRNGIEMVADVRSFPGSRRHPHFGKEEMARWLPEAGICYVHLPDLGGRRKAQDVDPSVNGAWRVASFKNYADYSLGETFASALDELIAMNKERPTAYMCSEALPWRCHRSLISTALVARGTEVTHIMCDHNRPHVLGQWGPEPIVERGLVTYPPAQATLGPS